MKDIPIDMSDPAQKIRLINAIRAMRGKHRVTVIRWHPRRTDRQNRYYWPCFVAPLAEFLAEQGQPFTDEAAHQLMAAKFLAVSVIDHTTGELLGARVRSTTDLSTAEFNLYLDQCAAWLSDMFGIVVPEPTIYREKEHQPNDSVPV